MKGVSLMGDFKTGVPELITAANQMVDTNEQLQDQGRQLAQAVDSVQGAWVGAAATAFNSLMERYRADFDTMNTALFTIAENVTGSADLYQQQEEEAAADISAITSTLDG